MNEELRESYHRLEGLESFITLDEPICPRFLTQFYHSLEVKRDDENDPYIEFKLGQFTFELYSTTLSYIQKTPTTVEVFYTSEWSLTLLEGHQNNRFFGPKHDLVKKNITIPRTTRTQLQRDPKKLFSIDICPELRGWELFLRENFFCTIGNRDHEVKKNNNAPLPFAMLLTRLYKHILETNPQAIVPLDRFTFHECVMNPLDSSRNPIKEKGKRVDSPLASSSSSSSSSDENEAPSFLEFYEELSDKEELTDAQREKREMLKCLNRYFVTIIKYLKNKK
ncbi:hypothetical protein Tco_1335052 [Tanacetum coccineum]